MRIALWTLRLAAVLPAIMASVVMLPDFADHTGPLMVLFLPAILVAYLLGFPAALVSGLAFRRVRPLIVVEALGPVLLFLTVGLGASVEAMGQ